MFLHHLFWPVDSSINAANMLRMNRQLKSVLLCFQPQKQDTVIYSSEAATISETRIDVEEQTHQLLREGESEGLWRRVSPRRNRQEWAWIRSSGFVCSCGRAQQETHTHSCTRSYTHTVLWLTAQLLELKYSGTNIWVLRYGPEINF